MVEDNRELIEKQTLIINTYINEIEQLRQENVRLSTNLEELIRKHTKHVVTRGTHAPEQATLYSVGTNTKKTCTRDVQVMFTPKSRDVAMSTDKFSNTRDVGLGCALENQEHRLQIEELNEIKRKYELMVEEQLKNKKSYRDVTTLCNLDYREFRDVALGCNLYPQKVLPSIYLNKINFQSYNITQFHVKFMEISYDLHFLNLYERVKSEKITKLEKFELILFLTIFVPFYLFFTFIKKNMVILNLHKIVTTVFINLENFIN